MKPLALPPNGPNPANFSDFPPSMMGPYLNQYHLTLFEQFKHNQNILGKRPMINPSNSLELQKRIKTGNSQGYLQAFAQPTFVDSMLSSPTQDWKQNAWKFIEPKQEDSSNLGNFSVLSSNFYSNQFPNHHYEYFQSGSNPVKEEYIKQEDLNVKQEDQETHVSSLTGWNCNSGLKSQSPLEGEVILKDTLEANIGLVEESPLIVFTRMFPDWDLVTIVRHIENGNSLEPSRTSQRIRVQQKDSSYKRKSLKEVDYPNTPEIEEDYRPGKSTKVTFRQKRKMGKIVKKL